MPHSLFYRDAELRPLTADEWRSLACDRHYGMLWREAGKTWEVQAEWFGLASTREERPGLFLTRTFALTSGRDAEGKYRPDRKEVFAHWFSTPGDAIDAAQGHAEKMRGRK
jgi:hypothetical protein